MADVAVAKLVEVAVSSSELARGGERLDGVLREVAVQNGKQGDLGIGESLVETETWSVEGLMSDADGVLGIERVDDVPLLDSTGEVSTLVSKEEAAIYENAGLEASKVNGRECLTRGDIDLAHTDPMGRTNLELMESGLAPLDPNGNKYELHHVQQENEGVLAELTFEEHRGNGNDEILHDKEGPSEIDRNAFAAQRAEHWKARAAELSPESEVANLDGAGESETVAGTGEGAEGEVADGETSERSETDNVDAGEADGNENA